MNRHIDPFSEVLVTVGAYEAVYAALQGHTDVGDEWVVIEPFFDCYESLVKISGGVPRFVPLKPVRVFYNKFFRLIIHHLFDVLN